MFHDEGLYTSRLGHHTLMVTVVTGTLTVAEAIEVVVSKDAASNNNKNNNKREQSFKHSELE